MDIEWLLSTLFDASLLSTSSRRQRRLFFVPFRDSRGAMVAAPLSLPGNYVIKFARPRSGHSGPAGAMLILARGA